MNQILKIFFSILLLFVLFKYSNAQDRVLFLDGKEQICRIIGVSDSVIWIEEQKRNKVKDYAFSTDDVYAIYYGDTIEVIVYKTDFSKGLEFSVENMGLYVAGARYARKHYKTTLVTAGGFIAGVGGGMMGFYGLLIPAAYDITVGAVRPFPRQNKYEPIPLMQNEYFILGYQNIAQKKKIRNVIISSISGVAVVGIYSYIMYLRD